MGDQSPFRPFTLDDQLKITPTDVAQFIRLDQCQRYLRLRLIERAHGDGFLRDAGVRPQDPPPLMMHGGLDFEGSIYAQIRSNRPVRDLSEQTPRPKDDASTLRAAANALPAGAEINVFQPRLRAIAGAWALSGDVDILRLTRPEAGRLDVLIVDIKSSAGAKVEHRLQVAFYARMVQAILGEQVSSVRLGVLYRGEDAGDDAERARLRAAANETFGVADGYLELVEDAAPYMAAVDQLVTGSDSTATRIALAPFDELPFHLTYRCDWCRYNPFCMKWAAEHDDLSLTPHLNENDKLALQRAGVRTATQLSVLKEDPATAQQAATLSATWPVGARLDELVSRARRYRSWKGDPIAATNYIPQRGYGSLPYSDANHNPNLVRIYVDAQHDNQIGHLYLLGALVAAAEHGSVPPERRRSVVHMTERPPETLDDERTLLVGWIEATLASVVDLAAPGADGRLRAPIHLIFFNRFDQNLFLDGLARHAESVLSATPLFDFLTQMASFDSPIATFLVDEIRELRNYPMLSQSLQSVSRFRRFDWHQPYPFPEIFRERLFDYTAKFDDGDPTAPDGSPWYTSRSRFDSQIPIEYAYAAWGALPEPPASGRDPFAGYRRAGRDELLAFQTRRLDALEFIAGDFTGNRDTTKTLFDLHDLATFEDKSASLAQALLEFVMIERFVELAAWKSARLAPPERRVLAGITMLGAYRDENQHPGVAARMRDVERRIELQQRQREEFKTANPDAKQVRLSKEQKAESDWSLDGVEVRLELDASVLDCSLQEALEINTLGEGESVVVMPRWTVNGLLPVHEQKPLQPTSKQLLYATRGQITGIEVERGADEQATRAFAVVEIQQRPSGKPDGFVFSGTPKPLRNGEFYTLDPDPNDWMGQFNRRVCEGLVAGGPSALYDRLADPGSGAVAWPEPARAEQARFLEGLTALAEMGQVVSFEPSKREYIGGHGGDPVLLVQGPPGTGKSFTTAFALLARIQGAMAAGLDYRIVVACHTHAAVDVLMRNIARARSDLNLVNSRFPELFARFFDERLLDVPLYRYRPAKSLPSEVQALYPKRESAAGDLPAAERFAGNAWAVLGATPGGINNLVKDRWGNDLFGHEIADCLVLDEASQLSLPTAIMAGLPLSNDGRIIVVGDHRQMPPIVKHNWGDERRRTFQEFEAFESLFLTLVRQKPQPPLIQFAESFRLHQEMAGFLRENIYRHDGIPFRSGRDWRLGQREHADPFVAAALSPDHALIVVTHNERASQHSNGFERDLIMSIANALYDDKIYGVGDEETHDGFGIVVPHRAQRAAFATVLSAYEDTVGAKPVIADTVERFQGDEREVIIVSATESDPAYLLAASGFLLEPRRLTVALSRAKRKLILVASESVFELFSPDEETFDNAQLWKNLLRRTCTEHLWTGQRFGQSVTVWGNAPL